VFEEKPQPLPVSLPLLP